MANKGRDDRFTGEAGSVERVGYMGKDGKIYDYLPPEDRMDMSQFNGVATDEAADTEE